MLLFWNIQNQGTNKILQQGQTQAKYGSNHSTSENLIFCHLLTVYRLFLWKANITLYYVKIGAILVSKIVFDLSAFCWSLTWCSVSVPGLVQSGRQKVQERCEDRPQICKKVTVNWERIKCSPEFLGKGQKISCLSCNREANKVTTEGAVELSPLQVPMSNISRCPTAAVRQNNGDLPKTPSHSLLQFHFVVMKHRA